MGPMNKTSKIFLGLILSATLSGCVSLRTYDEVLEADDVGTFVEVEGQKVHVEVQGEGAPVVLVHGFGASTYSWRFVAPELAKNYRTIAVDLTGFGYTERVPERERYTRSGQVNLILGVLDALGEEQAHFVGHSYGGGLVATLAHQHGERVRSLTLLDSTYPEWSTLRRRKMTLTLPLAPVLLRSVVLRRGFVAWTLKRTYEKDEIITPEVTEAYRERMRVEGALRSYLALTLPKNGDADRAEVPLEEIEQPVLAIWGADDKLTPLEEAKKGIPRFPNGRLEVLADTGHSPMEESPQEVVELIRAFLADVSS